MTELLLNFIEQLFKRDVFLGLVFTRFGVAVVNRSAEHYNLVKITPTVSEVECLFRL